MSDKTHFTIQRGSVVSDCMKETCDFIDQNLEFFFLSVKPIQEALGVEGGLTFISHEDRWSFSCRVDRIELGRVASAEGLILEGNDYPYDEFLTDLKT